jgi:acetyltransferase-like isoleucine patch superfamily enzyme
MNSVADRRLPGRVAGGLRSLVDFRTYFHALRLLHYQAYAHVREVRKIEIGRGTGIAPNVSFRHGEHIRIGAECHLGERCYLWAGASSGRIVLGDRVSVAPQVFITASDYRFVAGRPFREQPRREQDVRIGNDVWLGASVIVTAGVAIGDGCIVGAGAVVTRDQPPNSIAAGVPARDIGSRTEAEVLA